MGTFAFPLYSARFHFNRSKTTIPSLWRMGAGWRLWRLSWLTAWLFGGSSSLPTSKAWVLRTLAHCARTTMSACNILFVDPVLFPFDGVWGMHVRREFLQIRLSAALCGTLGSYLRDALQEEGSADAVACFPVPRAQACGGFSFCFVVSSFRYCFFVNS
jgi:hypothetical protein